MRHRTIFCLGRAKLDTSEIQLTIDVREEDSLQNDWGQPGRHSDESAFRTMGSDVCTRTGAVKAILGELAKYRMDMAMAFIWLSLADAQAKLASSGRSCHLHYLRLHSGQGVAGVGYRLQLNAFGTF